MQRETDRLYDVGKLTLFQHPWEIQWNRITEMFRGKKVFINSMPSIVLNATRDRNEFISKVKTLQCAGIVK